MSLLLLSLFFSVALSDPDPPLSLDFGLVDWLRSRNGIFNPKLEIRRADPNDPSSHVGIFATQRLKENELLIGIPPAVTITAGRKIVDHAPLECDTVKSLIREMRLGEESAHLPYVRYLSAQRRGQVPSAWSEEGKTLLKKVMHDGHNDYVPADPVGWIDTDWLETCSGSSDPLSENAAMLVVQRGWDDVLIPVFDMLNHRNGKWLNTKNNDVHGTHRIDVSASRDIRKGEEIYNSYNFCSDCGNRALSYGTPEILRDYGFVEQMPQRWIFDTFGMAIAFDFNLNEGDDHGIVTWLPNLEPTDINLEFLTRHVTMLEDLLETDLTSNNDNVPELEWNVILEYHHALTTALTHALSAAFEEDQEEETMCPNGKESCTVSDRYDNFDYQEDPVNYNVRTCHNEEILRFEDYDDVSIVTSAYQKLTFAMNPVDKDMCLDIGDTVQICSNYRPQYHEHIVHVSARYIHNVRRVVFVGGGDSMLLHEILKYPNLELVVGLELDQKVVRHSFKHFNTQPHFDDDRVQWWFGDATKSLLMLPKDYFGSFDLVLVDLSETVTSMSVTEKLDVLEALALLLKPQGIFVKNELYLEKMSEIFDHAVQIYWQRNPIICDQQVIMGSNGVNFLRDKVWNHPVENIHLTSNHAVDHFALMHDFRKKEPRCSPHDNNEPNGNYENEYREQIKSAGILMILEAENASAPLEHFQQIERVVFAALLKEGLNPLSTVTSNQEDERSLAVIVMREGYVVVRSWPEHQYCAFDILLWGGFDKLKGVSKALLAAVGSADGASSSYRIVVGGMFGSSTWKNDQKTIGPDLNNQNCPNSQAVSKKGSFTDVTASDIILEETMNLLPNREEAVVAIYCGDQELLGCHSIHVQSHVKNVIVLWTCPTIIHVNHFERDAADHMFACQKDTLKKLTEAVSLHGKIDAIVIDPGAPIAMAKIAHKIFANRGNKIKMLKPELVFIAMMPDKSQTWRRNFLETFRIKITSASLSRAEVWFNDSNGGGMEMGITSAGHDDFFFNLVRVTDAIEIRTGMDADIRKIQGGVWNFQPDFDPIVYLPEDYDQSPGEMQFSAQRPLGHQSVFQLEVAEEWTVSAARVKEVLDGALSFLNFNILESKTFADVGDGCVIVVAMVEGSVIVVWDGNLHVDINLFTFKESVETATALANHFVEKIPRMKMLLRDEQPRGFGRVVNFLEDIHNNSVTNYDASMDVDADSNDDSSDDADSDDVE